MSREASTHFSINILKLQRTRRSLPEMHNLKFSCAGCMRPLGKWFPVRSGGLPTRSIPESPALSGLPPSIKQCLNCYLRKEQLCRNRVCSIRRLRRWLLICQHQEARLCWPSSAFSRRSINLPKRAVGSPTLCPPEL